MTGETALLPRAMIVAGQRLGATTMLAVGLQVLDWLIDAQTAPAGHLSPVGSAGWTRGGSKPRFDQRPVDVMCLLLAADAAFAATAKPRYGEVMERAYAWFLGSNDLGLRLADPARGSCRDGLTTAGLAPGEGAEATLAWLIAAEHVRSLRTARTAAAAADARATTPPYVASASGTPSAAAAARSRPSSVAIDASTSSARSR